MGVNVTKGTHAASLHSYSGYNHLVRGVVCVLEKFHIAASFGASVSCACACVRVCINGSVGQLFKGWTFFLLLGLASAGLASPTVGAPSLVCMCIARRVLLGQRSQTVYFFLHF